MIPFILSTEYDTQGFVCLEAFGKYRQVLMRDCRYGKCDLAYEQECRTFISAHGLGAKVEFLGVKRDAEKFTYFAGCDIFCFPSYFEAESFGLVLVEAMQFAKPLVSTQWRGIPSVVKDGVNGYLTPIQDPSKTADKLVLLARDPALRERMGQEGRRIFKQEFTLKAFHGSMEQAFVDLF